MKPHTTQMEQYLLRWINATQLVEASDTHRQCYHREGPLRASRPEGARMLAYLLLCLPLLLFTPSLSAQSYAHHLKIPYREGALWGYCDTLGQVIHPPQYDSLGFFTWINPYAICVQNGKWGLVDNRFHLTIPTEYDALAVKPYEQRKEREILEVRSAQLTGLISLVGEPLIPIQYDSILLYSDFIVVYQSARLGVYNKDFKPLTDVVYGDCYVASEGFQSSSFLVLKKDSTYSKLTPDGAMSPLDANQLPRRGSQLGAAFGRSGSGRTQSMSRQEVQNKVRWGEFSLNPSSIWYDRLVDNDERGYYYRLLIQDAEGYALFDLQSGELIPRYYADILKVMRFSAGRELWFVKKNGKYGIVDESGNMVLPYEYDRFADIQRSHVIVQRAGLKGVFIPYTMYPPIPCVYENIALAENFRVNRNWSFGVFAVRKSGQAGYVGENGVEYFR